MRVYCLCWLAPVGRAELRASGSSGTPAQSEMKIIRGNLDHEQECLKEFSLLFIISSSDHQTFDTHPPTTGLEVLVFVRAHRVYTECTWTASSDVASEMRSQKDGIKSWELVRDTKAEVLRFSRGW